MPELNCREEREQQMKQDYARFMELNELYHRSKVDPEDVEEELKMTYGERAGALLDMILVQAPLKELK